MVRPWPGDDCPARRRSSPDPSTHCQRHRPESHGCFAPTFGIAGDQQYPPQEIVCGAAFVDTVMTIRGVSGLFEGAASRATSTGREARTRRVQALRPWFASGLRAVLGADGGATTTLRPALTAANRGRRTAKALSRAELRGWRSR